MNAPHARHGRRLPWLLPVIVLMLSGCLNASAGAVRAPEPGWQALNRGLTPHVAVAALAVDPRNAQRVYVGTAATAGLWITDDGGSTGRFAAGPLTGRAIYALSVDPARPDDLLAGTDAGLYHSADAGQTWQQEPALPAAAVFALTRDPDGAVLAAGAGPAVFRLGPGQDARWEALPALPGATAVLALAASPRRGLVLAGTDGAGLFTSRDGGRTWAAASDIGRTYVAALAFAGADGQTAYARTRLGLYATTDAGASWHAVAGDVPGRIDALATAGQGAVYLGTSEGALYRMAAPAAPVSAGSAASSPAAPAGGGTWQRWGDGIGSPGMFSSLVIAPGSPDRWYAGTSNGLYVSDDAGQHWHGAQPGPGTATANALALAADGSLWLGNGDGVFRSGDGGQHWEGRGTGLPADTVLALAPGSGDAQLIYAGLAGEGLYCSQDGGQHWTATGWTQRGVPAVLVDPRDPRHLFIRVTYERVYESRDGGQTWQSRWDGLGLSAQIVSLALDPQQPDTIYAGGTEGLFRSQDGAAHWQASGPELAGQTVYAIDVDPHDPTHLYAGATNGAYRSTDGGEHWRPWGTGLGDVTVTALAISPQNPRVVFAGTKYRGVFASEDGGEHWQYAGPARISVNALLMAPNGGTLYAATATGFYTLQGQER